MQINILNVKISNLTWQQVLERVKGFFNDNQQHLVTTPNPEMIVLAQTDEEFKKVLNQADLAIPDGIGLIFASWFLGNKLQQRITGVDFVWKIAELAEQANKSIYLLGGLEGVNQSVAVAIAEKFPKLKIYVGGDNARPADSELIKKINEIKPNILLVAFGFGRQEKWIAKNLAKTPSVDLAVGIGGALDFISGRVKRAPKIMRQLGLEWLWRFARQPWRWRRILTATCKFSWLVLKYKLDGKK